MNKILVLIDLNTLKRNPDAGKTERRICIGRSATLKTDCQISDPSYETIRTLRPALSHLFSYVQAVECPLCGAIHHPSNFWWPDDNEEVDEHKEAQCPSCRTEIEIEFESIKSALARIAEIIGGGDA
jgi:hypothetical protein